MGYRIISISASIFSNLVIQLRYQITAGIQQRLNVASGLSYRLCIRIESSGAIPPSTAFKLSMSGAIRARGFRPERVHFILNLLECCI